MGTDLIGVIQVNRVGDGFTPAWETAITQVGMPLGRPHGDIQYLTPERGWPSGTVLDEFLSNPSWMTLEELEDSLYDDVSDDDYPPDSNWADKLLETMQVIRRNAGVKSRHVRVVWGLSI